MHAPGDPIALLSDLLCKGDHRIAAGVLGGRGASAIAALVRAGVLIPDGVIDATICDACDAHHLVEVASAGPDSGYGWHCPEAGFVAADPDAVAAFSIGTDRVIAALSKTLIAAFGAQRWRARPLDGTDGWLVGVWRIGGAWTTVALARGLDSSAAAKRAARALAALAQNDAGLVLTVGEDDGFEAPLRFAVVPLAASLMLDAEGHLAIADDVLTRAVAQSAAARLVAHVGRPSVESKVFAVLDGLRSRGELPEGGTHLAGIVERAWPGFYPNEPPPKPSTLRKYTRRWLSPETSR